MACLYLSKQTVVCRGQVCLPPEAAMGKAPGSSSNVYAFGMLMYEVLFRREPYNEEELEVGNVAHLGSGSCSQILLLKHV